MMEGTFVWQSTAQPIGPYLNWRNGIKARLAGGHLCGKLLFTWLSLLMSLMVSFCAVFFPRVVLDGIWDLIESVSQGFPTYFYLS